ncbi:PAS domain S-box protein [Oceanimonas sp. NS1]|nr:PAS domain S-box protein [Oceanimonas sp. NS1]
MREDNHTTLASVGSDAFTLEHSLKFKRQLLQHVFDNALESIIVTNADGVIERVNAAFTQITGYRAEEVLGKTPRLVQSARHEPDFTNACGISCCSPAAGAVRSGTGASRVRCIRSG